MARSSHLTLVTFLALACVLALAGCSSGSSTKKKSAASRASATAAGRKTFSATCGVCHTLADANTNGAVGPNLDELQPRNETVLEAITKGAPGMPAALLHGQDVKRVADYVSTHASSGQERPCQKDCS